MRRGVSFVAVVLAALTAGWGCLPALAAAPAAGGSPGVGSAGMQLAPTTTCPVEAVDEINEAIAFVRGQTWTERPGTYPLTLALDLAVCRVVLHIGQLTEAEQAALQAGAGSRLAIEYRRDWAKPSRLALILWIVFGGTGVLWVFRRYGRG